VLCRFVLRRASELNNGVVTLDVPKASTDYQLQCNERAPGWTNLKNGNYLMVELPKNFGIYEGRDVEVYPQSAAAPDTAPQKQETRRILPRRKVIHAGRAD